MPTCCCGDDGGVTEPQMSSFETLAAQSLQDAVSALKKAGELADSAATDAAARAAVMVGVANIHLDIYNLVQPKG